MLPPLNYYTIYTDYTIYRTEQQFRKQKPVRLLQNITSVFITFIYLFMTTKKKDTVYLTSSKNLYIK